LIIKETYLSKYLPHILQQKKKKRKGKIQSKGADFRKFRQHSEQGQWLTGFYIDFTYFAIITVDISANIAL
jgi:hypothetical protein